MWIPLFIKDFSKIKKLIQEMMKKKKRREKPTKKYSEIKAITLTLLIISSAEIYLWVLELNFSIEEPYLWGNRLMVPYKLNRANELFSHHENHEKLKIITMGHSVAFRGFNPFTLDVLFNNKTISYNFGIWGTSVKFQAFLLKKVIIPKLKPDLIIWAVDIDSNFKEVEKIKDEDKRNFDAPMARYYNEDFSDLNNEEYLDMSFLSFSRLYRYRFNFLPEFIETQPKIHERVETWDRKMKRGFIFSYQEYSGDIGDCGNMTETYYNVSYNEEYGDIFLDTVNYFKEISLNYLIISNPNRYEKIIYPKVDRLFNKIKDKHFLNLNGEQIFANNTLHRDAGHLNYYGAEIYTEYIYHKLKNLI